MARRSEDLGFLGKGSNGSVRKIRDLNNDRIIALKIVRKRKPDGRINPNLEKELEILRDIEKFGNHIYFLKYYGYKSNSIHVGIMLELFNGRDVNAIIEDGGDISRVFVLKVFVQVSEALEFLHNRKIIHRDVKPANIMISGDVNMLDNDRNTDYGGKIKLIDFGFSCYSTDGDSVIGDKKGTPLYIAPEFYMGSYKATFANDVWAMGVSLYETLYGIVPIDANDLEELIGKLKVFDINWSPVKYDEDDFLFKQLFSPAEQRITIEEISSSLRACIPFA